MLTETRADRAPMSPRQVAQAWVRRYNARDANGIAILYHENAVVSVAGSEPVIGRRRIEKMFVARFRRGAAARFPEAVYGAADIVALDWRDLDGQSGTEFFTVQDGRIAAAEIRHQACRRKGWIPRWLRRLSLSPS